MGGAAAPVSVAARGFHGAGVRGGGEGYSAIRNRATLNELRELLERFSRRPWKPELAEHAIFGKLSEAEWLRWGYLHMDHYLRQFGI